MEGLEIRQFLLVPVIYCICELSIFLEFEGLKMLSPNSVSEILRVSKCFLINNRGFSDRKKFGQKGAQRFAQHFVPESSN